MSRMIDHIAAVLHQCLLGYCSCDAKDHSQNCAITDIDPDTSKAYGDKWRFIGPVAMVLIRFSALVMCNNASALKMLDFQQR